MSVFGGLAVPRMELRSVERLADELIELRCGAHSLANVYEYLLNAYGDASRAKADFIRFLVGDLPTRVLETASEWIAEEQGSEPELGSSNEQTVTIEQSLSIAEPLQLRASHG